MTLTPKERNIITDKLVRDKTTIGLEDWFALLDKKGAKKMTHAEIFKVISDIDGLKILGQWNHNLLTTTYEWNRGLKKRGQKENGFEISVSKTIGVPIGILYNSWVKALVRNKWLADEMITIRKATKNKSARITWSDNATSLSVDFYSKAGDRSQVVVQHQKLPTSKKATELKTFWSKKLAQLKILLEAQIS